jgi:pimeloyl-ACP methyl ester carboxylesterase
MPVPLNHSIEGEGSPILVLHGLFGSGTNWRSFARALGDRWQLHLLDLRNHGQSSHADSMTYPEMANDLRTYMDEKKIGAAVVLGHSMGGKVAMRFALESPRRVQRLVVVDMAPTDSAHDHVPLLTAMQNLDLRRIGRREQASQALAGAIPDAGLRQFLLQNLVAGNEGYRWRINLDALKSNLPVLHGFPLDGTGGPYDGPALFLRGQLSDYVPESAWPGIRALFRNAEIVTIENAGHWVHAEQPGAFLSAIEDFLATDTG